MRVALAKMVVVSASRLPTYPLLGAEWLSVASSLPARIYAKDLTLACAFSPVLERTTLSRVTLPSPVTLLGGLGTSVF